MIEKIKNITEFDFENYLIEKNYSNLVIPIYFRHVTKFLENESINLKTYTDYSKLKSSINEYLTKIPLSQHKDMIQAALHTYYCFVSNEKFVKRVCTKDFDINSSIESEVINFQKYLSKILGLAYNTIISNCSTIRIFLYSNFPCGNFSPEKININHIHNYLVNIINHVSTASKKTIVGRIRNYVKFLDFTYGYQLEEILKLPMTPPVWKKASVPNYLTDSELNKFFSAYNKNKPVGIRNYAIARCLKDLGLRCSEVAQLSLDDINWINGTIKIRKNKTKFERSLPLHLITGKAIEKYLLNSRPISKERTLFVRFKNKKGYSMGTSQIRYTIRANAKKAGLENFTGTHMFRHTTAKEMINNGIDLKTIADVLGHESIETTCIYTKLNFDQLHNVSGKWPEVKE